MLKYILPLFLAILSFTANAAPYTVTRQYVHPIVTMDKHLNIDDLFTMRSKKMPKDIKEGKKKYLVGTGSIVVIAPGYALTANHVVHDNKMKGVELRYYVILGDKKLEVKVVKYNKSTDMALIHGDFKCPCAPIAKKDPALDDEVVTVGYPLYGVYNLQFASVGRVQGETSFAYQPKNSNLHTVFVSTASAAPGNSGGGSFALEDGEYKLVGIVDAIGLEPQKAESPLPVDIFVPVPIHWIVFSNTLTQIRELLKGTELSHL